jgi:hypothetical protein
MDQRGKKPRTGKKKKPPLGARIFSLLLNVQTGSGTHESSYSVGTGFISGCKTAVSYS